MCLIVFAYKVDPDYPLILAANRDEYYARETKHCHWWEDQPQLLAGKDLVAGGTWMGMHQEGRFAAITNFRTGGDKTKYANSRGDLTKGFLLGTDSAENYLRTLTQSAEEYAGFNLLLGDQTGLYYFSNRSENNHDKNQDKDTHESQEVDQHKDTHGNQEGNTNPWRKLEPGIYGLSNHLLDTPWPKVIRSKNNFTTFINNRTRPAADHKALINLMKDQQDVPTDQLPNTGVSDKMEGGLARIFIHMDWKGYGTRATSSLWQHRNGEVDFVEQNYSVNSEGENIPDGLHQFRFSKSSPD